jgi:transcriptional regulator with XRE-family HTH domain
MTLGERVRALIKSRGDRLADAARASGIAYATLYEIAHDRSKNPSADNLHKLAYAYGVTVGWLLGKEGDDIPTRMELGLREHEQGYGRSITPHHASEVEVLELFGNFDDVVRFISGVPDGPGRKARQQAAWEGIRLTANSLGWNLPNWFFQLKQQIDDGEV